MFPRYKWFVNPHEKIKADPEKRRQRDPKGLRLSKGANRGVDVFPSILQPKPVVLGASTLKQDVKNIKSKKKNGKTYSKRGKKKQ